jgi:DNA polymerase-3 subunit gamma/tau
VASPFMASAPFLAAAVSAPAFDGPLAFGTVTEGALAKAPAREAPGVPSVEALRTAITAALTEAGHNSAAQLLSTGAWTMDASSLRIEVPGIGKKMLALTINAAAEKILRQELQKAGASSRFLVVAGEGAAANGNAVSVAPIAGSIQETALANPLVQRAKEIFNAEVRSVVDLRQK